jgi:hypothetical protein
MKIYGPYTRKDGRQHIVIVKDDGTKTSKSYPKYLMEIKLGRELQHDETVDHIDNNFTNDDLNNLQVLSRPRNSAKYFDDNPHLRAKMITIQCSYCKQYFDRTLSNHNYALKKNVNPGFFCSRSCQGKVYH